MGTKPKPVGHFRVGHFEVWIIPRGKQAHDVTVVDGRSHTVVRRDFTHTNPHEGSSLHTASHLARTLADGIAIAVAEEPRWVDGEEG